jgi:DNA-binding GntR family transcriptional regulator
VKQFSQAHRTTPGRARRDRRLLAKVAAFVRVRKWLPSAPELANEIGCDRTTAWRALDRLRSAGLVRGERRATWEVTPAGFDALGVPPVRALITRKPRSHKRRSAAVRKSILQRRLDTHNAIMRQLLIGKAENEELPIEE